MELKDLSQNWKKLQTTLKSSKSSPTLKRKASDDWTLNKLNAKRRAISLPRYQKPKPPSPGRSKMLDDESPPPTSFTTSVEANQIPADEIAATVEQKPPTLANAAGDSGKINEGLSSTAEIGKYISIDCEMVGVESTPKTTTTKNRQSALARVSIVNYHGDQVYDSYVIPQRNVTDWRTDISGMSPDLMKHARSFEDVQRDVSGIMQGRILVGHAVMNDLRALKIDHPRKDLRDTSRHDPYRALAGGSSPGLKMLAAICLGVDIQQGAHSSVEDARACMLLYKQDKDLFEAKHARRMSEKAAEAAAIVESAKKAQEEDSSTKKNNRRRKNKNN